FATGSNRVIPQPKGVIGVVSPWNYPLFLTMSPLTSILAAGNRAMVKMATNSQHLCRLLAEKCRAVFPEDTVAFLPGVRAQDFSTLPYDHLIFTGSADAGRTVMRSAAENLTPVTLELGGKSPTIICDDFDVDEAAARILYAKFLNAGQTCLAPDYLFVPEAKRDQLVAAARRIMPTRYPDTNQPSYTSVIDDKSYRRLRATLEDARQKGAQVVPMIPGTDFNDQLRKIPPHLVLDVTDDMVIMQEEIFGPLLPVKTYRTLDEVIAYVNGKDRPLGFYVFTNDKVTEEKLLYSTISGGDRPRTCPSAHLGNVAGDPREQPHEPSGSLVRLGLSSRLDHAEDRAEHVIPTQLLRDLVDREKAASARRGVDRAEAGLAPAREDHRRPRREPIGPVRRLVGVALGHVASTERSQRRRLRPPGPRLPVQQHRP